MREIMQASARVVCSVIDYIRTNSVRHATEVEKAFIELGEAVEAEFERDDEQ